MGTPFENFVNIELPMRQVLLRGNVVPSAGAGVPASIGAYYLNLLTGARYEKTAEADTAWTEMAAAGSSGYMKFTNNTGSTILGGTVVRINSSGDVVAASADALANCEGVFGITFGDTLAAAEGKIITRDKATVRTSATLTVGLRVYLSVTSGEATSTPPSTAPNVIFLLGIASGTSEVILNAHLEQVIT